MSRSTGSRSNVSFSNSQILSSLESERSSMKEDVSVEEDNSLVIYIKDRDDLETQLIKAGNKLVVLSFLLLGNDENEKMLNFLAEKASIYNDLIVVLVVDVTKLGELALKCEAVQIPWFTFIKASKKFEAYHSVNCNMIESSIRNAIEVKSQTGLRTYIKDVQDLDRRLVDATDKLVVLAFLLPDDKALERLNIDLDEINDRHEDLVVFKVDVDICKDVTVKYHVQGVPTIVFIKNHEVIEETSAIDMDRLKPIIAKYTSKSQLVSNLQPPNTQETVNEETIPRAKSVHKKVHTTEEVQLTASAQPSSTTPVSADRAAPTKKIAFQGAK